MEATHQTGKEYGSLKGKVLRQVSKGFVEFQPDDGRAPITIEAESVKELDNPKPAAR